MEFSQAEIIRDYVRELLSKKTDLSTSTKRNQAVDIFLQKHADRKFNKNSIRKQFQRIVEEENIKIGKAAEEVGKRKPATPKFKLSSDMESEINAAPQNLEHLKQGEQKTQDKAPPPPTTNLIMFNEKDVSAALAAFWLIIKMMYPTLELLTDEEKESLGRLWLPAFTKYLTENWKILGIPLLATLGMLLPKIKKARDNKKVLQKTTQEKANPDAAKKLTCPWCNQIFDREVIEQHKEICTVRRKYESK